MLVGAPASHDVATRIEQARLAVYPFPHVYLDCLLSRETLSDLGRYWPLEDTFTAYSDGPNRKPGEAGRFGVYVLGHTAAQRAQALDPERRRFWKQFARDALKPIGIGFFKKMFGTVQVRFPSVSGLELETFAVLVNCYQKLDVPVHTDPPPFLISIVIYLDDVADADGGTSIYCPLASDLPPRPGEYLERGLFRLEQTLPSRAGSATAMACTGGSFHGVEPLEVNANRLRRTINMHIRLTADCAERLIRQTGSELINGLERWRECDDIGSLKPSSAELAVIERSFLYGDERL